jgi:hypothetical protein
VVAVSISHWQSNASSRLTDHPQQLGTANRIRDVLMRIRIPQIKDPALFFGGFQEAAKKVFFCLLIIVGKFKSVLKYKKSLRSRKKVPSDQVFSSLFCLLM